MLHPLMVLFGTINPNTLEHDSLLDLTFMSKQDITIIKSKILEIGEKVYPYIMDLSAATSSIVNNDILKNYDSSKGKILYVEINKELTAFESQYVNDIQVEILPETALLLTRLYKAFLFWNKNMCVCSNDEQDIMDLSEDALLNRIENFPYSIYNIVYKILAPNKELSKRAALQKINTIRQKLIQYQGQNEIDKSPLLLERLSTLSDLRFWKELIYSDYLKIYMKNPPRLTSTKMEQISKELNLFGISGFNPPYEIEQVFPTIPRKTSLNIDTNILVFLEKLVRSGGLTI